MCACECRDRDHLQSLTVETPRDRRQQALKWKKHTTFQQDFGAIMSGLPNTLIFPLMEQLAEHSGPAVDGMYQVAP